VEKGNSRIKMICDELANELASHLKELKFKRDVAIAFSGGLDSSVIAFLMRDYDPHLYTVGHESAKDVLNSLQVANLLSLNLTIVDYTDEDIIEGIRFLRSIDPEINPVEVGFELPLYLVLREVGEREIYTGQGADELFGGYGKYLDNPNLMDHDFDILISKNVPRERKMAEEFGKKLVYPYLDDKIVSLAREIPLECKIRNGVRKWVLRRAAEFLGVPRDIFEREKKAAQYGSGIWKRLVKMAKTRGLSLQEFVEKV
jgi:asparagine synthase (glutamine-hydrolysing)